MAWRAAPARDGAQAGPQVPEQTSGLHRFPGASSPRHLIDRQGVRLKSRHLYEVCLDKRREPRVEHNGLTDEAEPPGKDSPTMPRRPRTRAVIALGAAFAALLVAPGAASAGLVASAGNCDAQTLSQAFLPFADPA